MLMEPIILVFIKFMGAAISGHWDLRDTGATRDYDSCAVSWAVVSVRPWVAVAQERHNSRQSVMLGYQNGCAQ